MTRKISLTLALGDAVLLLLFAFGGEVTHELFYPDSLVLSVLHAALPFAIAWYAVAFAMDAFAEARAVQPKDFLLRALGAWLIAAPLGIIVRGIMIDRAVIPVSFLLATYAFGILFFVGWRIIFLALLRFGVVRQPKGA